MAACAATKDTGCRINAPRLLQRLHALRQVGRNAAGGIDRQLGSPTWGVTHNLGGFPSQNVAAISVIGAYGA